jgi:uncharacterized protein (TIRG00374 family)
MDLISDRKYILKGVRLFVLLTILGFAVIIFFTTSRESFEALRSLKLEFLLLALLLVFADILLGGLRIYIFFTKEILKKVRFVDCAKANLTNYFLSAITPACTGGGPGQLYSLTRRGVPLSGAVSVTMINFFSTLLFFLATYIFVFFLTRQGIFAKGLTYLVRFSFLTFFAAFLVITIMLIKPKSLHILFRIFSFVTRIIWRKNQEKRKAFLDKIEDQVVQLRFYLQHFFHKQKHTLFFSFLLTVMIYFNKYLMAYVILKGLGLNVNFLQVMYLQIIQFFILYFSPTPGASGIAEISSVSLMSTLMPKAYLPVFAILWRIFSNHLGVAFGGWVTLKDINQHFKEKQEKLEEIAEEAQIASS